MREAMASDRPAGATVSDSSNDRPTHSRPARRRRTRAQPRCSWECTLRSGLSGRQSRTKPCRSWCKQIGTETGLLPVVPFPGAPSCPSGRRRATRRDLATERGRLCRGDAVPLQPIHGPTRQGSKAGRTKRDSRILRSASSPYRPPRPTWHNGTLAHLIGRECI